MISPQYNLEMPEKIITVSLETELVNSNKTFLMADFRKVEQRKASYLKFCSSVKESNNKANFWAFCLARNRRVFLTSKIGCSSSSSWVISLYNVSK
jgi:hypothetical protein